MRIPIANKLRKRAQIEVASLQDEIVEIIYNIQPNAVLHDGTALWRCYSGNRFSDDLDFYSVIGEDFKKELIKYANSRDLVVKKFKKTSNTVFSKISNGNTEVRMEIMLKNKNNAVVRNYEKIDGTKITVFTLSKKDLLFEKLNAYKSRKLIRDIYDVFFLISLVNLTEKEKKKLRQFMEKIEPPKDEKNLKTIVYSGAIPSFRQMIREIKNKVK